MADETRASRAFGLVLAVTLSLSGFAVLTAAGAAVGGAARQPCPPGSTVTPSASVGQTPTASPCPTSTPTPTPTPTPVQCDDGIDNDGDGKIDHPADPGCDNKNDNSEVDPTPTPTPTGTPTGTPGPGVKQCEDGVDNDGDGKTDHPADPDCDSPKDDSEATPPVLVPSATSIDHVVRPRHRFQGTVTAPRADCRVARRVVVKKVVTGKNRVVARDLTNDAGFWAAPHNLGGRGRYYAVAKRKLFTDAAGVAFQCMRARSSTIRVSR